MNGKDAPATKADLESLSSEVKSEMETLENRLLERLEKTETTLLREFRRWAISFESRFDDFPHGSLQAMIR
jgi:hypothetical protein